MKFILSMYSRREFHVTLTIPFVINTKFKPTLLSIADKNDGSIHYFMEANEKSERIWYHYFRLAMGGFAVSTTAISVSTVLFCHWTNKGFELENLYRVYRIK